MATRPLSSNNKLNPLFIILRHPKHTIIISFLPFTAIYLAVIVVIYIYYIIFTLGNACICYEPLIEGMYCAYKRVLNQAIHT